MSCHYAHPDGDRYAFILNPKAGGGRAQGVKALLDKQVGKCIPQDCWTLYETTAAGDGIQLAKDAISSGYTILVSIGGDGTHNEVINGIFQYKEAGNENVHVNMALIPVGTGGDLQRALGTKSHTLEQLVDAVLHPSHYSASFHPIDIGSVECTTLDDKKEPFQRYFINTSSCGISGAICNGANNSSKMLGGFATFFYQTCFQTLVWKNRDLKWRLNGEGDWQSASIFQFVLANGRFFGGGMKVAPTALMNDGLFDIVIFKDVGVTDVTLLPRMYNGSHLDYSKVERVQAVSVELIHCKEEKAGSSPVLIEADGEIVGTLPAKWILLPAQVSLLYSPAAFE